MLSRTRVNAGAWAARTLLLFALVLYATAFVAAQRPADFTGRVVGVVDGDTIDVLRDGRSVRVRLDGIDAPESDQDFGRRAKQFTSAIVFGQTVDVHGTDVDRYGRLVARVVVDGRDLSVALVEAGLAWHFLQYSHDPILAAAETKARADRVGLWTAPNPIAPWAYRAAPTARATSAPAVAGAADRRFFGNTRSHVLHAAGCPSLAQCKYCTQGFDSVAAGRAAGYRPHGGRGGCLNGQ